MDDPVRQYLSKIGRKGGAAGRGSAKARTTVQARKAAKARWAKHKTNATGEGRGIPRTRDPIVGSLDGDE